MNTKYIVFITSVLMLLAFPSCDDYLDVQPEAQFSETRMFADEEGFKDALYGVYHTMIASEYYGKDMTWGFLDALAHYYPVRSSDYYAKAVAFDYTASNPRHNMDKIWEKGYNAIANVNNLLLNLEEWVPDRLEYYNYYKGEALAMRAFLHFELYRCFGPVAQTESNRTIPYITKFSNEVPPQATVAQMYQNVINDLTVAMELLKDDPILNGGNNEVVDPNDVYYDSFLDKRKYKMNYLAVKALLARVYYTKGDLAKALQYASEVIAAAEETSGSIRLTNEDDWKGDDPDLLMTPEIILGFVDDEDLSNRFQSWTQQHPSEPTIVKPLQDVLKMPEDGSIYEGLDHRRNWFKDDDVANMVRFNKYLRNELDYGQSRHAPVMGAIRLSEMIFIACEALAVNDIGQAVELFNTYASARQSLVLSVETLPTVSELEETLTKERRREFYGDGQLFFYYKLKNALFDGVDGNSIQMTPEIGMLPFPEAEIVYGKRVQEN